MPRSKGNSKSRNKRKNQEPAVKREQRLPPVLHDEPSGPDLINNLNDYCLIEVFQLLSIADRLSIASVCQRWRDLSKIAWKNVKILRFTDLYQRSDWYQLPPKSRNIRGVGKFLKKCGTHVKELTLNSPCDSRLIPFVNRYCPNLETLRIYLGSSNWNSKMVFPKLQKAKFRYSVEKNRSLPVELLQALPLDSLTEITIYLRDDDFIRGILPTTAATVFKNCSKLSRIALNHFDLSSGVATAIFQKSTLTSLDLYACFLKGGFPRLSSLTNLEYLDVSEVVQVNDYFLKGLPQTCPNLKFVHLYVCDFTDEGIIDFWQLSKLEKLTMGLNWHLTDAPFANLKNLKSLSCGECSAVHDDGIIKLILCASNLQELNLRHTSVTEKILRIANQITKERTNELPLKIVVDEDVKNSWSEEEVSPLLTVKGVPNRIELPFTVQL